MLLPATVNVRVPPMSVIGPAKIVESVPWPPVPIVVLAATFTTLKIVALVELNCRMPPPLSVTVPVPKGPFVGAPDDPVPSARSSTQPVGVIVVLPE